MRSPLEELASRGVVLLDGAMGSELMGRGLLAGGCTELFTVEHPEAVREVHRRYLEAGSQVIQTCTFGANRLALGNHGLEARVEELNAAGVARAREAVASVKWGGERPLVAGNLGPSGKFLPPVGEAQEAQLEAAFAEQARALAEAGVDYLAIETMTDLREARCALRAARSACDLSVTVCMSFDRKKRGFFTLMGDRPEDVVRTLQQEGAWAVGANCSVGSEAMRELLPQLLEAAEVPVILKPNAGLPEVVGGQARYLQTPEQFARDMLALVEAGAALVGGCCGCDPKFLAALSEEIRS